MLDIFGKKKIAELSAALANEQAKSSAQEKKTRTAAIIGGSTTAATAAAAIATHFIFGSGKKINKEKLAKYDQVVEERDRVIGEKAEVEAALKEENAMKMIAIGDADNLANAINSRDPEYMVKAKDDHYKFRKEIYGDITTESLRNSIEMFDHYIKELEKADQPQNQNNNQNQAEEAKIAAEKKAEAIKNAEAVRNTAYQKAEEAKTVFETAEAALKAVTDPNNIPTDIQKAYDDAKAALDTAAAKLKEADEALKALQNNNE